jgi:ParB family chromosome partitioning protein
MKKRRGLGLSLENMMDMKNTDIRNIPLDDIEPSPYQPRQIFSEEEIDTLAQSIQKHGLLQPIVVRRKGDKFEIIAGERRYRALQKLGKKMAPVIVVNVSDKEAMALAIIENIERKDLTLWELASSIKKLKDDMGLTLEEIASILGKSKSHISNILRMFQLPESVLQLVKKYPEKLTLSHIKLLLEIKQPQWQITLAEKVISEDLSTRQLEEEVNTIKYIQEGKLPETQDKENKTAKKDETVDRLRKLAKKYIPMKSTVRRVKNGYRLIINIDDEETAEKLIDYLKNWTK